MLRAIVFLFARLYKLKLGLFGPIEGLGYRRNKSEFDTNYPFF